MNTQSPSSLRLFNPLCAEAVAGMALLQKIIAQVRPLSAKRSKELPYAIRDLWGGLTHSRQDRRSSYLSAPEALSAYLRYFLPWNVYRYLRLLPSLDLSFLKEGSVIVDIGSGPLTIPIALAIAKPELLQKEIIIYAVDRAPTSLDSGLDILSSLGLELCGKILPWKIHRVHGGAESRIREKADLVCAGYSLNEFESARAVSLEEKAELCARILGGGLKDDGRILVLESGDTKAASLISALRARLLREGMTMLAPCPHAQPCPMPGYFHEEKKAGKGDEPELVRDSSGRPLSLAAGKRPWCHFNFSTQEAPPELLALSAKAGLPKEGASLSFLFASKSPLEAHSATGDQGMAFRVASDSFALPQGFVGRYACCALGYALLRAPSGSAPASQISSGDLVLCKNPPQQLRDPKTRAIVFDLVQAAKGRAPLAAPQRPKPEAHRETEQKRKPRTYKTPKKGTLPPLRPGGSGRT